MRRLLFFVAVGLVAGACSDADVAPTSPNDLEIRASHEDPAGTSTSLTDECVGESPCDAFFGGPAGFCFVPPLTDNHLSDGACSAPFVPGLPDGSLQLEWCQVVYSGSPPSGVPTLATPLNCGGPVDLTWDGTSEFYQASVKFKKPDTGKIFRLYIVRGSTHFAHRDVIVDPNLTTPADEPVLAVGTGNIPVKVRLTGAFTCDDGEDDGTVENCLIVDDQHFQLGNAALVQFGAVTNPFFLNAELGECETADYLTYDGKRSHDLARLGCTVDIDGEFTLEEAATIVICEELPAGLPAGALRVIHQQEAGGDPSKPDGLSVLPPVAADCSALAFAPTGLEGYWHAGLEKLAGWLGVKELVANAAAVQATSGGGGAFFRNSTFELAVVTVNRFWDLEASPAAAIGDRAVLDLGARPSGAAIPVAVQAVTSDGYAVAGEYVQWFRDGYGSVACPTTGLATGASCETSTSDWGEAASFRTGDDGIAWVWWTPGVGPTSTREVYAVTCGAGVYADAGDPNGDTPIPAGAADGDILGVHQFCDRDVTAFNGYKNGPNAGADPFDAVDSSGDALPYEIALNDPELTWQAQACPTPVPDGYQVHPTTSLDEWPAGCFESYPFIASVTGKTPSEPNAELLWTNDGTYLYVAIKVRNAQAKDLNDAFFVFDNVAPNGTSGATYNATTSTGDDIVVMRLAESPVTTDWWTTAQCAGSPKASLCGNVDTATGNDALGAAKVTGSDLFWEFRKALSDQCPSNSEDFCLSAGDFVGISGTITGGQGGGKGGTSFPANADFVRAQIK